MRRIIYYLYGVFLCVVVLYCIVLSHRACASTLTDTEVEWQRLASLVRRRADRIA